MLTQIAILTKKVAEEQKYRDYILKQLESKGLLAAYINDVQTCPKERLQWHATAELLLTLQVDTMNTNSSSQLEPRFWQMVKHEVYQAKVAVQSKMNEYNAYRSTESSQNWNGYPQHGHNIPYPGDGQYPQNGPHVMANESASFCPQGGAFSYPTHGSMGQMGNGGHVSNHAIGSAQPMSNFPEQANPNDPFYNVPDQIGHFASDIPDFQNWQP
ncbi:Oidioi.mRNA.OKI2018_I69.chr2.g6708.t1.cds [Oikopleura dioica]|uniref:Oidioi.mRNA.OKI2018_I69.chr2.g6708.t1.cds n=1 Tax=Oikopleura dioica TaxID=34765 RepID=A0ABN7TAF9_OIKDI|nr:Oidioi.mRNA.OKI2018_I69.chr2.g6708.t1.cds [Oikopleura dioica]